MAADRNKEVTRLLKRGLNHYGLSNLEAAIDCWERARAIDPENNAIHDYLANAYQERDLEVAEVEEVEEVEEFVELEELGADALDDDSTPFS